MNKYLITAGVIVVILSAACRPAPAIIPATPNITSPPQGISINTPQPQMVGKPAPNFQLIDNAGKPVSLADFQGKPVLLVFWASWSPDCQKEMAVIQQIYTKWQNQGLVLLTVDILNSQSEETPANLQNFMAVNNYSFPVLLDEHQLATIQYHVADTPTNFLIDKGGVIREITAGPYLSQSAVETSLTRIIP